MDLEALHWLLTAEGQAVLAEATRLRASGTSDLRTADLLRRTTTADRAAAAMTQADLRARAVAKFGDLADRLWFTPDGLEQATRLEVARHRAARVAAAQPATVVDLGCGIGGDLLALAEAGLTVTGVDLDPVRVAVAAANLHALGLNGTTRVADATTLDLADVGLVFADPARRTSSGRVFDVDSYLPSWAWVESLLARTAVVKVAPGIPHDRVPPGTEAEWVSVRGEVKEAALWSPALAGCSRRATLLTGDGPRTLTEDDDPGSPGTGSVGSYLYEPDGAVIRAGLVTAAAALVNGWLVDEHLAYVTADVVVETPFARGYEVLEEVPYHLKPLKAALRARDIGRLTIKKRGVDIVPEQLRRRLALQGSREATLVLTRVEGRGTALLVRPL